MLALKLQAIMIGGSVFACIILLRLITKYKLEIKYSLLWFLLNILLIVLSIFPDILNFISDQMGFKDSVNALFSFGILILILIVFSFTVALSRMSTRIRNLTQEIGLLKREVHDRNNSENHRQPEVQDH
jgi:hypothetical protein